MRAKEHERLRYHVTNHGQTHYVDLACYNGNGKCSCLHFSCRLEPQIVRLIESRKWKAPKTDDTFRCKHIQFCFQNLLHEKFMPAILKEFPDSEMNS